jgi:hypothetical protein
MTLNQFPFVLILLGDGFMQLVFLYVLPCHCEGPIHGPALPTNCLKKIDDFRN